MLSTSQLATMRSNVTQLLPDSCTIQAKTVTTDNAGGWTETWDALPDGIVPCRLDPLNTRRALETFGDREAQVALYQLTVPYDAPIALGRRVVINTHTYEIRQLVGEHSWRVSRRALLSRIE
jgi:hypothetical protein